MSINDKILIIEDEAIIAEELRRIVVKLGYKVTSVVHHYEDALDAFNEVIPDLVLLDIGLNYSDKDGIDIGEYINKNYKIPFIYITANADLTTIKRAKVTEPASYILKPLHADTIFSNIEIALHKWRTEKNTTITVTHGSKKVVVPISSIVFLKSDNTYTEIHIENKKIYAIRGTLKSLVDKLPAKSFIQVHRSYVVNLKLIQSYSSESLLIGDTSVPVGNSYKNGIMKVLKNR